MSFSINRNIIKLNSDKLNSNNLNNNSIIIIPYINNDNNLLKLYNIKVDIESLKNNKIMKFYSTNNNEIIIFYINESNNIFNQFKTAISFIYSSIKTDKSIYHLIDNEYQELQGLLIKICTYRFNKFFKEEPPIKDINILINNDSDKELNDGLDKGDVVNFCRELQKTPSNCKTPDLLSKTINKKLNELNKKLNELNKKLNELNNVSCKIYDEEWIKEQKMGGILAVSKGGSDMGNHPRFMFASYNLNIDNLSNDSNYICLVGKGITFDSGGLNLKRNSMTMNMDMSGVSTCIGILMICAKLKLAVKILCVLPICDNMPGGNSYRQGDIITHCDKTTSEIHNTDAEGRVILADALGYIKNNKWKPKLICIFATLTGAAYSITGGLADVIFSSNPENAQIIIESGKKNDEKILELPIWDDLKQYLKSDIADIKNSGYEAGGDAMMAMHYLKYFIPENIEWMHFDLATTIDSKNMNHLSGNGKSSAILPFIDFLITKYIKKQMNGGANFKKIKINKYIL